MIMTNYMTNISLMYPFIKVGLANKSYFARIEILHFSSRFFVLRFLQSSGWRM